MIKLTQKESGAYFTPDAVVRTLAGWAVRHSDDRLLDPSCGDGRFLAAHANSVGIEQDPSSAEDAIARAPSALVHEGDFFAWAANTHERFECTAGNPPFIRYQTFKGTVRDTALRLCLSHGAKFSGLSSSWAPFLVAAASLLVPGGRMAFVVPAEIGHAPYARPLLEYLVENFSVVHIVAFQEKLFPELSEDCWLLFADGFGAKSSTIRFSALRRFRAMSAPPTKFTSIDLNEWRNDWNGRLRPFIMSSRARDTYRAVATHPRVRRFGAVASVGIGYVTGANDFFHLRPSEAKQWKIPQQLLHPSVRNGRALPQGTLTAATVAQWCKEDEQVLLLRLSKTGKIPASVQKYLDSEPGQQAREAYKCRVREPWYSVPDVQIPDFFMSYMSGKDVSLVRNDAGCSCTNSVHSVRVRDQAAVAQLIEAWETPFIRLSCELEGHPLGGGMLKLEPGEAVRIILPPAEVFANLPLTDIEDAVTTMREWRHYGPTAQ
ncbi:adenine-specific DNA-methyltransferase [Paraburkholderia sp. GAS38]|jgi:adenine-specific DNA-methyltransferase|uniref:N-6 DNA methylase n=1 Tax=Paraburkholderia sp. GAS38 TaxID=3035133 RepID=UPI003D1BC088